MRRILVPKELEARTDKATRTEYAKPLRWEYLGVFERLK